jgi:hypothetical protein
MLFIMLMPTGIYGLVREIRGRFARAAPVALDRR